MDVSLNVNLNVNLRGKRECERESDCKLNAPNQPLGPTVPINEEALSQHFNANEFKRT